MAVFEYSGFPRLENDPCVVAVEPDMQKVSFHSITDFLLHSIIAKLLSLYTYERVLFESQHLVTLMRNYCQPCMCCGAQVYAGSQRQSVLPTGAIAEVG